MRVTSRRRPLWCLVIRGLSWDRVGWLAILRSLVGIRRHVFRMARCTYPLGALVVSDLHDSVTAVSL